MPPTSLVLAAAAESNPKVWTAEQADDAMRRLLDATLAKEKAVTERDTQIAAVQLRHSPKITAAAVEMGTLILELEQYFQSHRPKDANSIRLAHGTIGVHVSAEGALVPLNGKWSWEKIGRSLERAFKTKFFHKPKPPAIDKVKVKRELDAEQLKKCGMKIERAENFAVDLDRYQEAA